MLVALWASEPLASPTMSPSSSKSFAVPFTLSPSRSQAHLGDEVSSWCEKNS